MMRGVRVSADADAAAPLALALGEPRLAGPEIVNREMEILEAEPGRDIDHPDVVAGDLRLGDLERDGAGRPVRVVAEGLDPLGKVEVVERARREVDRDVQLRIFGW